MRKNDNSQNISTGFSPAFAKKDGEAKTMSQSGKILEQSRLLALVHDHLWNVRCNKCGQITNHRMTIILDANMVKFLIWKCDVCTSTNYYDEWDVFVPN